jgi:phenylacetate-CoA ligase
MTPSDRSAEQILGFLKTKKSIFWEQERKRKALDIFHRAATDVPAYKDFLKKNKVNHDKIRTFEDFQSLPTVNKKNYLRQYSLAELSWNGDLKKKLVFTATSGSTGEPIYFPRMEHIDWEGSLVHEMFLQNASKNHGPILVVVCFGMGVWIGGLLTYKGYEMAAQRGGYPVSLLTPGINKKEIYNALKRLSPLFSQTILVGYPPFIKDILDGAKSNGINLKKLNLRLSFAAEAFTEQFRDYLVKNAGIKSPYLDTINIYGSADIGAMGFETPTAILIRRLANADPSRATFNKIFGNISKTPTLAQYNPSFITFEAPQGEIYLTGNSAVPLVRYDIGDHGGTMSYPEIKQRLAECDIDLEKEITGHGLRKYRYELPFVFVYERTDFSTTLYGLQIYPEHIREALIQAPVNKLVTGKFAMMTEFDKNQNQYLQINLETLPDVKINSKTKSVVTKAIVDSLEKMNSEFRELHRFIGERALPRLVFWPAEDGKYFRPGIKQKWVLQSQ